MPITVHKEKTELTDAELLALSIPLNGNDRAEIAKFEELLNRDLDWYDVTRMLDKNHLSPFFYYNLKKLKKTGFVPPGILERLTFITNKKTAINLSLFNSFKEIVKHFHERHIDVIALKGMALFLSVYKTIPFRHMEDMDLLVKENQLKKAEMALADLGYEMTEDKYTNPRHLQAYSNVLRELTYKRKAKPVDTMVEIHWGLTKGIDPILIDDNILWDNLLSLSIDGIPVSLLSPENLLIHLSIHLHKHIILKETRLVWFCDIIETIKFYKGNFNWGRFLESISKEKIEDTVYPVLAWLYVLKFIQFPKIIEQKIRPFIKEEFLSEKMPKFINEKGHYLAPKVILNIQGLHNKIHFIVNRIFPNSAQLKMYYPEMKNRYILSYYLHHWKTLSIKTYRLFKGFLSFL